MRFDNGTQHTTQTKHSLFFFSFSTRRVFNVSLYYALLICFVTQLTLVVLLRARNQWLVRLLR